MFDDAYSLIAWCFGTIAVLTLIVGFALHRLAEQIRRLRWHVFELQKAEAERQAEPDPYTDAFWDGIHLPYRYKDEVVFGSENTVSNPAFAEYLDGEHEDRA